MDDNNARAAFIMAQSAVFNCRLEAMKAANQHRLSNGLSIAYDDAAFAYLELEFPHLQYKEALAFLMQGLPPEMCQNRSFANETPLPIPYPDATIDGMGLVRGDSIVFGNKEEIANSKNNGIYTVTTKEVEK